MQEEKLIDGEEAAHLLSVGISQLRKLVRAGTIRPVRPQRRTTDLRFRLTEILAYCEIKDKGMGVETAMLMARQATAEAQALRREVEQLKLYIGVQTPQMGTDRDSVIEVLLKAEDALQDIPTPPREELLYWARTFHGLTEGHFVAIALHTKSKEPWRTFMSLARYYTDNRPSNLMRADIELANIYALLQAGFICLRQTAYFYVRSEHGTRVAGAAFPETKGDVHDDVIALSMMRPR